MKKILLAALILTSANAYECEMKDTNGGVFRTISSTYKDHGDSRSMWFEYKKYSKKAVIESGKSKLEAFKDKMTKTVQSISYGKGNKVTSEYNGKYDEPQEVIPGTIGEWRWDVLNHWAYVHENNLSKKEFDLVCMNISYGISRHGYGIGAERADESQAEELKQPSMTPSETQKWLDENKPFPK